MNNIDKAQAALAIWNKSAVKLARDSSQVYESQAASLLSETPATNEELIEHYEDKCHNHILNGNFRDAVYYNTRLIFTWHNKIMKKYCE